MNKSKSIDKKYIKFVSKIIYNDYERIEDTPEKYKTTKVIGKLRDNKKIPNFENILEDILIVIPYDLNNIKHLSKNDFVIMEVIL
jgi:hypothetical protein